MEFEPKLPLTNAQGGKLLAEKDKARELLRDASCLLKDLHMYATAKAIDEFLEETEQ